MTLAFFDLDKTLLAVNSARLWLRLQWRDGTLGKRQMLRISIGLFRYQFGLSHLDDDIKKAILGLKGKSHASLQEHVLAFYREKLCHHYRPGALASIAEHRQRGHKIVLLTSSPHLLARVVADELSMDNCLCTKLEIDRSGHYTGYTIGPLCFGDGKVVLAKNYADHLNVSLNQCTFYSDSITDLPMLKSVGEPVAVNPDLRLRRVAREQKWKIVDWGIPNVTNRIR